MMRKTEPCSCAVAEDMIKLLLAGGKAGRGDIGVLQVCNGKQSQSCLLDASNVDIVKEEINSFVDVSTKTPHQQLSR